MVEARAFWTTGVLRGELRHETLPALQANQARVRSLCSGISRGTETLVFKGEVPARLQDAMACPHMAGTFPHPVKYGYCVIGVVEDGPDALLGQRVFCLHPHQDRFIVATDALRLIPDDLPLARATLAANLETALTVTWDLAPKLGERLVVLGAGVVGLLSAWLLKPLPGIDLTVSDVDPAKRASAAALGLRFALPDELSGPFDGLVHASGNPAGLATALGLAGAEARLVEASWFGTRPVTLPLGEAFHHRRLRILASQVGTIPPAMTPRWGYARRFETVLRLLRDPGLDALLSPAVTFDALPTTLHDLATGRSPALCQPVLYPN